MTRVYVAVLILIVGLFTGCASRPIPPPPLNPAEIIRTLTSSVALSVRSGEQGISGRGYLVMRTPDQFRLMILSPFGTTLAEIFLLGDDILYLASTQNVAYSGKIGDLPDIPALQGWRLLRWTTEHVPPPAQGETRIVRHRLGVVEQIDFDTIGLVVKKRMNGDEISYEGYHSVAGVPVPTAILITDRSGIRVRLTLDEPEVNTPLDESAFAPPLDGVKVLPLNMLPAT